jgi:hypothetical protein
MEEYALLMASAGMSSAGAEPQEASMLKLI